MWLNMLVERHTEARAMRLTYAGQNARYLAVHGLGPFTIAAQTGGSIHKPRQRYCSSRPRLTANGRPR